MGQGPLLCLRLSKRCEKEREKARIIVLTGIGNRGFVESVKFVLSGPVKGRKVKESGKGYQLCKSAVPYGDYFEAENEGIELQNDCFWNKYSYPG